jgi:small subunit ribosomal protein S24e
VDVSHPGKATTPKADVQKLVATLLKADAGSTIVYGFKAAFGGGRSSGFGLVYDDAEAMKKFEPKHRLLRLGIGQKKTKTRKQWKDAKRKQKRTWGTGRRASARAQKKAAAS